MWGQRRSAKLIKHELGNYLPNLVSRMTAALRDKSIELAEEYMKKVAEEEGVSITTLHHRYAHEVQGANESESMLLQSMRGNLYVAPNGRGTLIRFFSTPYDLRKLNEMGHFARFLRFLRLSLVGDHVAESYLDSSGNPSTLSVYSVDEAFNQSEHAVSPQLTIGGLDDIFCPAPPVGNPRATYN